jgi:hypothetical protein
MIHVAEAGESKGRVVLELCSGAANPIAIEAALWIARAFQSEIESLFVEDEQLLHLAGYPFAREISLSGRSSRALTPRDIERHFRFASASFQSEIERRARAMEVPFRPRVVRSEPISALAAACAECGPWNLVAIADPFTSPACPSVKRVFEMVADTTGLLIVGPQARRMSGPIVVGLEESEHLPAMLAAAQRLAAVESKEIDVILIADDEHKLGELEPAVRLMLADREEARVAGTEIARGSLAVVAERLRRLQPGLVLGRFGGLLVPSEGDLRPLASALECPLLLVRLAGPRPAQTAASDEAVGD